MYDRKWSFTFINYNPLYVESRQYSAYKFTIEEYVMLTAEDQIENAYDFIRGFFVRDNIYKDDNIVLVTNNVTREIIWQSSEVPVPSEMQKKVVCTELTMAISTFLKEYINDKSG